MDGIFLYLLYFFGYSVLMLWFGKYGFDRVKNSKDFFIGNGRMGFLLGICTFSATWISATSMLSLTGSIYMYGIFPSLFGVIGWFVGAFLLIFLAYRLKDYPLRTLPEFFYLRYQCKRMQLVGGIAIVITHLFYIMFQIRGFGLVVGKLLEIPYSLSIFLVYLFIIYSSFGGFQSVARSDSVNLFVIVAGALTGTVLIVDELSGTFNSIDEVINAAVHSRTSPIGESPPFYESGSMIFISIFIFISWGLGKASYPQYINRIFAAKDKATAVKMIVFSVLLLVLIYSALFIISTGIRILAPELTASTMDEIVPSAVQTLFDAKWAGIILVSIMAAAISTANSQLLILAGSFSWDIYKNVVNPQATEEKIISLSRWTVSIGATIALFISFSPPDTLLSYSSYIWGSIVAVFFIPLYGGLYWRHANRAGAWASVISGIAVCFAMILLFPFESELINPAIPGSVVSLLSFLIVSHLSKRKGLQNEQKNSLPLY